MMLLSQGFAQAYREEPNARQRKYLEAEVKAKALDVGLWACGEAETLTPSPTPLTLTPAPMATITPVQTGSPSSTPAPGTLNSIECIFFNGVVPRSEADEYVQIVNSGKNVIDLIGWSIRGISDGTPVSTFPSYTPKPGGKTRIYTNENHPEWGRFSFDFGRVVWDNTEPDIAALTNSTGEEVSRKNYPPGC